MTAEVSIAELLDTLFTTHLRPDGKEYTYSEVSRQIKAKTGRTLDSSYIGKIRSGETKNPGRDALMLLCLFFEVPASYFFPELNHLQSTMTDQGPSQQMIQLRRILRQQGLTADVAAHIEALVRAVSQGSDETTGTTEPAAAPEDGDAREVPPGSTP